METKIGDKFTKIYLLENCYGDKNKVYIGKEKSHKRGKRETKHKQTYSSQITSTYIDQCIGWSKEQWKPLESFYINYFKFLGFEVLNKNGGGGGPSEYNEQSKQKMKESHYVEVLQYTLNGEFVKEWKSMTDASISLNKNSIANINQCCLLKQKSAFNFQWRYKIKDYPLKIEPITPNSSRGKPKPNLNRKLKQPLQYDLKGNFIKEWGSKNEVEVHFTKKGVGIACINKTSYCNSQWRYKTENYPLKIEPYIKFKTLNPELHYNSIPIIQLSTDGGFIKEWVSQSKVNEVLNINNISACLKGKQKKGLVDSNGFIKILLVKILKLYLYI